MSISKKLLVIVAFISIFLVANSVIGFVFLNQVGGAVVSVDETANQVRLGARMNQDAVELNRAEYRLAAEAHVLDEIRAVVAESEASFRDRYERALDGVGAQQRKLLDDAKGAFDIYAEKVDETVSLAQSAEAAATEEMRNRLVGRGEENRPFASQLCALPLPPS
ncbi:Tar ligand binding domain-containing protein [Breoghania sp.]|uniref:Tar ligand binding domain-containing protein n=1 Tax=Breoghania sp. TaxID=2065378 RepID=UPI002609B349|nr:Tar ligand binding domain-containing protein [Breoghania sp.]MDJ0932927.1 Tar ligand binding domain-containing protein [Breoghania sp.]